MKMHLLLFILIFCLIANGCRAVGSADLQAAQDTLTAFFTMLAHQAYDQAPVLYGGDYEPLHNMNPFVQPDDLEGLWRAACEVNGYQCLEIHDVVASNLDAQGVYHFTVEFQQKNGALLVVGPCCLAAETLTPPRSQFEFTVRSVKGKFLVQDLPVLTP